MFDGFLPGLAQDQPLTRCMLHDTSHAKEVGKADRKYGPAFAAGYVCWQNWCFAPMVTTSFKLLNCGRLCKE